MRPVRVLLVCALLAACEDSDPDSGQHQRGQGDGDIGHPDGDDNHPDDSDSEDAGDDRPTGDGGSDDRSHDSGAVTDIPVGPPAETTCTGDTVQCNDACLTAKGD